MGPYIPRRLILGGVPPKELSSNNRNGLRPQHINRIVSGVKETFGAQAMSKWTLPVLEIDIDVSWTIIWPKGRRKYDIDSLAALLKPVQDCLQGIVYANDSQIVRGSYAQGRDDTGTWPDGCIVIDIVPSNPIEGVLLHDSEEEVSNDHAQT